MKSCIVTYNDELVINELERFGEICYDSAVMKMIWIKTKIDMNTLHSIKGVVKVEIETKITRCRW